MWAYTIRIYMRGAKDARLLFPNGAMARKNGRPPGGQRQESREKRVISGPRAEGREQIKREKRQERTKSDREKRKERRAQKSVGQSVSERREKPLMGSSPRRTTTTRGNREKREERRANHSLTHSLTHSFTHPLTH